MREYLVFAWSLIELTPTPSLSKGNSRERQTFDGERERGESVSPHHHLPSITAVCESQSRSLSHCVCVHLYSMMIVGVRNRAKNKKSEKDWKSEGVSHELKVEWITGDGGYSRIVTASVKAHRPPLLSINSWKAVNKRKTWTLGLALLINKYITLFLLRDTG